MAWLERAKEEYARDIGTVVMVDRKPNSIYKTKKE
jgi:hypothetical protein